MFVPSKAVPASAHNLSAKYPEYVIGAIFLGEDIFISAAFAKVEKVKEIVAAKTISAILKNTFFIRSSGVVYCLIGR